MEACWSLSTKLFMSSKIRNAQKKAVRLLLDITGDITST
jgi:hypothetical protein